MDASSPATDATAPAVGKPPDRVPTILVVGDWVVDEHWVTGVHRSPTSSRTGTSHIRALHRPASSVQSLCAAGRSASILTRALINGSRFCDLIGLGLWADGDTDELAARLDPAQLQGRTPHQITHPKGKSQPRVALFNMGESLSSLCDPGSRPPYGTNRVIRIYQQTGARIDLINRIDWELPYDFDAEVWDGDPVKAIPSGLHDIAKSASVDAILVKDICKGVVCPGLIMALKTMFPGKPWFVSTKAWSPDWLSRLAKEDVRLLLVPQVATECCSRTTELNSWITKSGVPSKEALAALDELAGRFDSPLLIVALPDDRMILARHQLVDSCQGIVQLEPSPKRLPVDVPMASVFFAALSISMLAGWKGKDLGKELVTALSFTQRWMEYESGRVTMPVDWDASGEEVLELRTDQPTQPIGRWTEFDWGAAQQTWTMAMEKYGVIQRGERLTLEVGKAMTDVDGYVCCVQSRRQTLHTLTQDIRQFRRDRMLRSRSYMLIASPGSGKTYLVRCLARHLELEYLGFNITQMVVRGDLISCFDRIATTLTQNRGKGVLVFVDEINAVLDGQPIYDAFLAPLEEGIYVRGEKTFNIGPCVWLFAGTEDPTVAGRKKDGVFRESCG